MSYPYREKWTSECGTVTLYCGDCLEILPTLAPGSVDAVVTDPPYVIGAISTGVENAKCGTWADMQNAAYWFAGWFSECRRITRGSGFLSTCGNWRSIPTLLCALSRIKWAATSCVIWDKQWIGPAYTNAFRPTYELAIVAAMEDARIYDRSAPDLFRGDKWMAGNSKTTSHPAEKPVDFMLYLIGHLSPESGCVVDPFMGSGTTGVACVASRRKFVGIELDESHFATAKHRIQDELNRVKFLEPKQRETQRTLMEVTL